MKKLLSLFCALLLLAACAGPSASSAASAPSTPASSAPAAPSSKVPAPAPEPVPEPATVDPAEPTLEQLLSREFFPPEELPTAAREDLAAFADAAGDGIQPEAEWVYLYLVDEAGEPVPDLLCYPDENRWNNRQTLEWWVHRNHWDHRSGLSRNSGILPLRVDFDLPTTLYIANGNAVPDYEELPFQQVALTEEGLDRLRAGELLQVVWTGETPRQTVLSVDHIEVTVTGSDGQPAADRIVFLHFPDFTLIPDPAVGDIGFADCEYRPRCTDENGVARFSRENIFGTQPGGYREILVLPERGGPSSPETTAVVIEVPEAPPWTFNVTLN